MKRPLALFAALLWAGAAQAQDVTVKPIADVRLRYEHVDQADPPEKADALTLRARAGAQATSEHWSLLIEGEGTVAPIDHYNDGTNGNPAWPLVVDPENIELNRAQLRYADDKGLIATLGRQRLELADQRFVGSAGFRQNEQTFDAARAQWSTPGGFSLDLTYAWNDLTVNGKDGAGARQRAVGGDNVFALLGWRRPAGTLTAFAYLVDQDEALVQGFRLSSQTYGLRFAGNSPVSKGVTLGYAASWARQSDYHRNPNDYSADYWLAEASLAVRGLTATGGYEVLGASNGAALTSVQTPLASLFKWQGWADRLTTTPPNGVRDLYGAIAHSWPKTASFDTLSLGATWHRFESDRLDQHYGDELDLLASARRGRATLSARYARYRADAFAADVDKFWLSLDWVM